MLAIPAFYHDNSSQKIAVFHFDFETNRKEKPKIEKSGESSRNPKNGSFAYSSDS